MRLPYVEPPAVSEEERVFPVWVSLPPPRARRGRFSWRFRVAMLVYYVAWWLLVVLPVAAV